MVILMADIGGSSNLKGKVLMNDFKVAMMFDPSIGRNLSWKSYLSAVWNGLLFIIKRIVSKLIYE